MTERAEIIFADGLIVKCRDSAPDYVLCELSVKVDEFIEFMLTHNKNGWINLEVKKSKAGRPYANLDTWEPRQQEGQQPARRPVPPPPFPTHDKRSEPEDDKQDNLAGLEDDGESMDSIPF